MNTDRCNICGTKIQLLRPVGKPQARKRWTHVETIKVNEIASTDDHKPKPTRIDNTIAWLDDDADDHTGTFHLWNHGYRPLQARFLQRGMKVAYRATDIFQFGPVGPVGFTEIEDVAIDDYIVKASTWDRGVVECDDGDEVWVLAAEPTICGDCGEAGNEIHRKSFDQRGEPICCDCVKHGAFDE